MVGPLTSHPVVRATWPVPPSVPLGYREVAQHLLQFLARQRPHAQLVVDAAAFGRHLEAATGASLDELGVVLVQAALPDS